MDENKLKKLCIYLQENFPEFDYAGFIQGDQMVEFFDSTKREQIAARLEIAARDINAQIIGEIDDERKK